MWTRSSQKKKKKRRATKIEQKSSRRPPKPAIIKSHTSYFCPSCRKKCASSEQLELHILTTCKRGIPTTPLNIAACESKVHGRKNPRRKLRETRVGARHGRRSSSGPPKLSDKKKRFYTKCKPLIPELPKRRETDQMHSRSNLRQPKPDLGLRGANQSRMHVGKTDRKRVRNRVARKYGVNSKQDRIPRANVKSRRDSEAGPSWDDDVETLLQSVMKKNQRRAPRSKRR